MANTSLDALLLRWDRFASARFRMRHLPPRLLARMGAEGAVLDVGAGDGRLARHLMNARPGLRITGVDIGPRDGAHIPVMAYDGARLPFADESFDLVLLIDVLHHADDPAALLREAMRVSRGRVLIKDHYWITRLDHWLLRASDYLGNRVYGVPLPYAFLRLPEWTTLFARCGAAAVSRDCFVYGTLDRCKQVIFVVEAAPPLKEPLP